MKLNTIHHAPVKIRFLFTIKLNFSEICRDARGHYTKITAKLRANMQHNKEHLNERCKFRYVQFLNAQNAKTRMAPTPCDVR